MAPTIVSPVALVERTQYGFGGRGQALVLVSIIMTAFSLLLVFNRVFWRVREGYIPFLGDDYAIISSATFATAFGVCNIIAVDHGYGLPIASLSHQDAVLALQLFWVNQIFYKLTINVTKISILLLYKRIFLDRDFPKRCHIVMALVGIYATASIAVTVVECRPVEHTFNRQIPGQCINLTAFWYSNAVYNVLTDLVILALPVPVIRKLTGLNKVAKINLGVVFSLGMFTSVISVLRMTTLDASSKAHDQTYGTYISTVWSTAEANAAITAACLPMLRTLYTYLFPTPPAPPYYSRAASVGVSQSVTNDSGTKISAARTSPVASRILSEQDWPGPIELNRLRNASRSPIPEPRPYSHNSSSSPLSRVTLVSPAAPDVSVKVNESDYTSSTIDSVSHDDLELPPTR